MPGQEGLHCQIFRAFRVISADASSRAQSLTGARLTIRVTREGPLAFHKRPGEAKAASPLDPRNGSDSRYGSETVVPSPEALMVNTPVAVSDAYTYADQPDGGGGTEAMNGPATWP